MSQLIASSGKLVRGYLQTATRFAGGATQAIKRTTNIPNTDLTIAGWVRIWRSLGADSAFFGLSDTDENTGQFSGIAGFNPGTDINLFSNNQPGGSPVAMFTAKLGIWTYLALTVSGGVNLTGSWYLDDGTNAAAVSAVTSTLTGAIPYAFLALSMIDGLPSKSDLREFRVWSAALSSAELLLELKSITPVRTANLNAWYPLITTAGAAELTDMSGNGNNLTASATTPTTIASFPGSPAGPSFLNQDQNLIVDPFDPSTLAGCQCWLRSDRGVTLSGSNVSTWANQIVAVSGDATQPTGAKQPSFNANGGLNNLPRITYAAGQGFEWALDLQGAMTVAIVYKLSSVPAAGSGEYGLYAIRGSTGPVFSVCVRLNAIPGYADRDWLFSFSGTVFSAVGPSVAVSTNAEFDIVTYNGGSNIAVSSYTDTLNNVGLTLSTTSSFTAPGLGSLGCEVDAGHNITGSMIGDLYEVVVYNRALTPLEVSQLARYFNLRYGI